MDHDIQEPQQNISYKGMIVDHTSETRSIPPRSGQHIEELVTTFEEILASYENPLFIDPFVLPLIDLSSMRYVDSYSSYQLPLNSTTTQYFGTNPSSFGFPEGLGNSYFSTTFVVVTASVFTLPKKSMT
jgi:hypothetical protein